MKGRWVGFQRTYDKRNLNNLGVIYAYDKCTRVEKLVARMFGV